MTQLAKKTTSLRLAVCRECTHFKDVQPNGEDFICGIGKVCCGGKQGMALLSFVNDQCPQLKWAEPMFERVYVISLERTPTRLVDFKQRFDTINWPFKQPTLFKAMDGNKLPVPSGAKNHHFEKLKHQLLLASNGNTSVAQIAQQLSLPQNVWGAGGGAWGCMESHRQILRDCIMADVESVLILEDDAEPVNDFDKKLLPFLKALPYDWDGMMLGGQHFGQPTIIADGIVKTNGNVNRTHAYGVRGKLLKELYSMWNSFFWHCDHALGDLFDKYNVFAPSPFLIAQGVNQSQISGRLEPSRNWSGSDRKANVILLHANRDVVDTLRPHGLHTGYTRDSKGIDVGLYDIFQTNNAQRLRDWVSMIASEATVAKDGVGAIWYPDLDAKNLSLVKSVLGSKFVQLRVNSVERYLAERTKYDLVVKSS